jgi:elongation factor Ts
VARNESFVAFCAEIAKKVASNPEIDLEADRVAAVQKIGENIQIARRKAVGVEGNGIVGSYIHTGGKVGVLVQVGTGKAETTGHDAFKQLVRDLTLQIAAAQPHVVSRESVPEEVIAKEKEIAAEQFKDKPAAAIENILKGKMEKFYATYCLVDQGFVKDGEQTVKTHIANVAKELGDEIEVKSFVRFQIGEATE